MKNIENRLDLHTTLTLLRLEGIIRLVVVVGSLFFWRPPTNHMIGTTHIHTNKNAPNVSGSTYINMS